MLFMTAFTAAALAISGADCADVSKLNKALERNVEDITVIQNELPPQCVQYFNDNPQIKQPQFVVSQSITELFKDDRNLSALSHGDWEYAD